MLINEQTGTITASSGTISANLTYSQAEIKQIIVKAATSTTTFDVKLVNVWNLETFRSENCTGKLTENVELPTKGNFTLTIYNASADEAFNYYVVGVERYA